MHTLFLGDPNALSLPLANHLPLIFRDKRKQFQNQIADQRADQILIDAGIENRHIENFDMNSARARNPFPLFQNFFIIAPQPIQTLNNN